MRSRVTVFAFLGLFAALGTVSAQLQPDPAIECDSCPGWNRPHAPFQIFGNTYYVGTAGLSAILITSDAGHILLDGALSQSAPAIDRNIRTLGFRTEDVRLIVNSHAHFDHAAGIAALQRLSGATVATSAAGVEALRQGAPLATDPQSASGSFPAVSNLRAVDDGETLTVGDLAITGHHTPGHTPGGTTRTWRPCEGTRCLDFVYADSLSAVSDSGFRYTDGEAGPERVASFRRSIQRVSELPCDILVSTHPELSQLFEKQARADSGAGRDAFIDSHGCEAYAGAAMRSLDRRVAEER
jgi:metallo-beta-lactamase class B